MKALKLALVGCVVLGLTAAALGQKEPPVKDKIVGTWETKEGFALEFTKDGKLKLTAKINDKELKIEGTYSVEGNKLNVAIKQGDKEDKQVSTIKSVTDDKMVVIDKDGKVEELKKKK